MEFVVNNFILVEFSLCTTQLAQISHSTIFVPGPCTTSFDDYSGFQPKITQPKHGLRAPLTGYCSNYKCNFLSCCSILPHNFGKYKLTTFSNISRPIIVVHTLMIGQLILLHTRPRAFMLNLPLCKKGQLISNHA